MAMAGFSISVIIPPLCSPSVPLGLTYFVPSFPSFAQVTITRWGGSEVETRPQNTAKGFFASNPGPASWILFMHSFIDVMSGAESWITDSNRNSSKGPGAERDEHLNRVPFSDTFSYRNHKILTDLCKGSSLFSPSKRRT